jgi:hypothetical protein
MAEPNEWRYTRRLRRDPSGKDHVFTITDKQLAEKISRLARSLFDEGALTYLRIETRTVTVTPYQVEWEGGQ